MYHKIARMNDPKNDPNSLINTLITPDLLRGLAIQESEKEAKKHSQEIQIDQANAIYANSVGQSVPMNF